MRNTGTSAFGLLCAGLAWVNIATADTLQVPAQYSTIQDVVDAASSGDEIVVAPGTYSGNGFRDIDLGTRELVIRSQARDYALLSCDQTRSASGTSLAPLWTKTRLSSTAAGPKTHRTGRST
jgi:hypothetical protein